MSSNPIKQQYDQAMKTLRAGDAQEAELICRRVLPQSSQDPNIICLLGDICLRQRRAQEAANWFNKVLKKHKGFPRALEGLGLALLADGKARKAADCLLKACAAAPNRSTTRVALARALAETGHQAESKSAMAEAFKLDPRKAKMAEAEQASRDGRMEDAEKVLREILGKHPDNTKALRMLGNIAVEANRFKAGRRLLERALNLAPGVANAWTDMANLYLKQDLYEEALKRIERAIELDPGFAHTYVVWGNVLTRAQRMEEAVDAYEKGLELNPHNSGALSGMGHVLKTIGRQEEAIDAFRRCIRANPAFGEAYWSLANLKTFEFDPAEVQLMETMTNREELADEPKVNMLLSLGKHFENEKDYGKAFEYYAQGNDLRRQNELYDPVHTQVVNDRIIEVFTPEFFEKRPDFGDSSPAPILIVGLPRSGSTLIEQILASHSQVEGTMELPDLGRTIGRLNRQVPGRKEYPEAVLELDSEQVDALGRYYIDSTMRYRTDKPYFIDKMPNNFPAIGFLHLILPNAKVIDARRHPIDSCLGSYKQLFFKGQSFTYDQYELGHYYLEYRRIMDHWNTVLPGKVLEMNYEELVADQETQTRRLLEHCGLPWEDRCLRFYETERAINTASSEQVRQPIYTKAVHFWRNYEQHLGELIETLEPLLKEMPPEDQPESIKS